MVEVTIRQNLKYNLCEEKVNAESNLSKPAASSVFEPKNLNGEDTKHFYESVIQRSI